MLSAHHIFKENAEIISTKNVKANSNVKPKGLGLKNSTNTSHNSKSKSSSLSDGEKPSNVLKKNISKQELKSSTKPQASCYTENSEEWPEAENMYIYNDSDDDYEDILPKSERITKAEIDCLFVSCRINRFVELTADALPTISLESIEDFEVPCHSISYSDLLYDDFPIDLIPVPDNPFKDEV